MYSRNKLVLHDSYPEIRAALSALRSDFVIDGEIAASIGGRTSFSALQHRRHMTPAEGRKVRVRLHVFDVMRRDGRDLRRLPLLERKAALEELGIEGGPVKRVRHRRRHGEKYLSEACAKGMEGIIAKRIDSTYEAGRSKEWLKFKCGFEQELVIGGWTDPQGSRVGFGALLVGYYEEGRLRYAGKVGTGYSVEDLLEFKPVLERLEIEESPFTDAPRIRSGVHWVRPELVCQVGFAEWTSDGRLRHPRFLGMRSDKHPNDVVREV
jgi:bifunctional non-homologous end joining protein LigD